MPGRLTVCASLHSMCDVHLNAQREPYDTIRLTFFYVEGAYGDQPHRTFLRSYTFELASNEVLSIAAHSEAPELFNAKKRLLADLFSKMSCELVRSDSASIIAGLEI